MRPLLNYLATILFVQVDTRDAFPHGLQARIQSISERACAPCHAGLQGVDIYGGGRLHVKRRMWINDFNAFSRMATVWPTRLDLAQDATAQCDDQQL